MQRTWKWFLRSLASAPQVQDRLSKYFGDLAHLTVEQTQDLSSILADTIRAEPEKTGLIIQTLFDQIPGIYTSEIKNFLEAKGYEDLKEFSETLSGAIVGVIGDQDVVEASDIIETSRIIKELVSSVQELNNKASLGLS